MGRAQSTAQSIVAERLCDPQLPQLINDLQRDSCVCDGRMDVISSMIVPLIQFFYRQQGCKTIPMVDQEEDAERFSPRIQLLQHIFHPQGSGGGGLNGWSYALPPQKRQSQSCCNRITVHRVRHGLTFPWRCCSFGVRLSVHPLSSRDVRHGHERWKSAREINKHFIYDSG